MATSVGAVDLRHYPTEGSLIAAANMSAKNNVNMANAKSGLLGCCVNITKQNMASENGKFFAKEIETRGRWLYCAMRSLASAVWNAVRTAFLSIATLFTAFKVKSVKDRMCQYAVGVKIAAECLVQALRGVALPGKATAHFESKFNQGANNQHVGLVDSRAPINPPAAYVPPEGLVQVIADKTVESIEADEMDQDGWNQFKAMDDVVVRAVIARLESESDDDGNSYKDRVEAKLTW
ncbi:MAG: hypothetical protein MRY21_03860 [Simkaniaceae bacterium]|nr:hypothetical protein [Simkaniaceae bacterium]